MRTFVSLILSLLWQSIHFVSDSDEEVQFIKDTCASLGVEAVLSEGWAKGGEGTKKLAEAVVDVVENKATQFKPLYDWKSPVKEKIAIIAKEIYGADRVIYDKKSRIKFT